MVSQWAKQKCPYSFSTTENTSSLWRYKAIRATLFRVSLFDLGQTEQAAATLEKFLKDSERQSRFV
jgi:hypothetical protein